VHVPGITWLRSRDWDHLAGIKSLTLRTVDTDDILFLDLGDVPVWKLRILDSDNLTCFHLYVCHVWKLVRLQKCVCVCFTLSQHAPNYVFVIAFCWQSFVYRSPMITYWIWFTDLCLRSLIVRSCFCRVFFIEYRFQSFVYEVSFRELRLHKYVYRIVFWELCLQTFFDRCSLIDFVHRALFTQPWLQSLVHIVFFAELCLQSYAIQEAPKSGKQTYAKHSILSNVT